MPQTLTMRLQRRGLTVALVLLALLAAIAPMVATAQEATPAASPAAGSGGGPALGDAVVLLDNRGDARAQMAVLDVIDPFEDAEDDAQRGFRYVALEIVVENLSDEVSSISTYDIRVVDAEGTLYDSGYVSRSEASLDATPDLTSVDLEVGQSTSGLLVFEVIDGASPALIAFTNSSERFTLLADLREETPADGEATTLYDAGGAEVGTVSVDEALPALEERSDAFDAARGETVFGAVVTIENSGDEPLTPELNALYVVDEFGFLYGTRSFFRDEDEAADLPDLAGDEIAAGAATTGLVTFVLPLDARVSYVLYLPGRTQLFVVAQLGDGPEISGDELAPVPPIGDDGVAEEPAADDAGAETPGATADCVELEAWGEATVENLSVFDTLGIDDLETVTTDELREAADTIREVADAQGELDVPELGGDANDAIITYLDTFAEALEDGADEVDGGAAATEVFGEQVFDESTDLGQALVDLAAVSAELQAVCPGVEFGL